MNDRLKVGFTLVPLIALFAMTADYFRTAAWEGTHVVISSVAFMIMVVCLLISALIYTSIVYDALMEGLI